jgi:nicotinamide-nucleotide amidase
MNEELLALAARVGERLRQAGQTVAVAESSAGGLAAAALLAQPGASAYFRGGAVVYTGDAKSLLLGLSREAISQPRAATPEHALILARGMRERLGATWGIGETGAAGPTGNRYGDPPGHSCLAVSGPVDLAEVVQTGSPDRPANMVSFAVAALRILESALERASRP